MRWKYEAWAGVLLLMTACGGRAPNQTSPSPTVSSPTAPTSAAAAASRHVYGVIADGDDGSPVAGASVSAVNSALPSKLTDGNGYFDLETPTGGGSYPGNELVVSRAGYDGTRAWIAGNQNQRHDLRLYRPLNITAGSSTSVALSADNSSCGFDDEFQCRPVYIAAPSNGTLVMDIDPGDASGPSWLLIGNLQYPFHGVTHAEIPVTPGSTVIAQILRDWTAPPNLVTLRTTLSGP
jgi:hypothetical protein